jgi:AbrB family looped-hinge helix DNA binding protein
MVTKIKKIKKGAASAGVSAGDEACCVDAMVTVDARGQIVLPKELRTKAKIKAGDKFALVSCISEGKVCCISLIKADEFAGTVKIMMSPMMKGVSK